MQVEIVPDEAMQKLAKDAVEVQDACNGCAVSGLLNRTMSALMKYSEGGDWVNQHPITKAILDKMLSLARMPQDSGMAHVHCMDLAEGKTIEVEIIPS